MTKLSDRKIRFICRHAVDEKDWGIGPLAEKFEVSRRRIQQLVKTYRETGKIPSLNPNRRPKGPPLTQQEKEAINHAWEEKRVGARMLYKELKHRGFKIPHHKINAFLKQTGKTVPNLRKQKKRKRCRYERKHSFSLLHGDWHQTSTNHPFVIVWLDDASRLAVSGGEFPRISAESSIEMFKRAIDIAAKYNCPIREANTDRGSEFFSSHPNSVSAFQIFLALADVRHVVSGKSNPQTNGKLERFWYEYDRHRWRFRDLASFLVWYNDRLHGALWLDIAETPLEAVERKLPTESLLGLFWTWAIPEPVTCEA